MCTDKSSVSLGLIQPPGYSVIHLPRHDRRGGGVGLIYRDSYKAKRVKFEKFSSFERQTVSLSCGTQQLVITCVYLSSGVFTQDFSSQFSELLSFLQAENAKHLIVGDFNFHVNIDTDVDAKKLISRMTSFRQSTLMEEQYWFSSISVLHLTRLTTTDYFIHWSHHLASKVKLWTGFTHI